MNKKIIGGLAILTFMAMASFNANFTHKNSKLSDLILDNISVLAQQEDSGYDCSKWGGSCTINLPDGGTLILENVQKSSP
jgi:hypothetical protein